MSEPMGILQRRTIEAEFAKGVFDEFALELGAEKARAILARAVEKMAIAAAQGFAAKADPAKSPIENMVAIMPLWTKDDALRIEVLAQDETRFDFNVTRCRYAETYKAMGIGHLGAALSCNRDGKFCEGFDPRLKLERTQTLMQGASHCDFRYRLDPPAA